MQWHVHEMLFGFGWAVMGGFLLTASKNWVKIRGLHGLSLAAAAFLWLLERVGIYFFSELPSLLQWLTVNTFMFYIAGYLLWSLIYYYKQDSFKDNFIFIIALPLFIISKNLIINPSTYVIGWQMALGLFRVAFVVMFERTITQFMKNSMGTTLKRIFILDSAIKFFAFLAVFGVFLTPLLFGTILLCAGALLMYRFFLWQPLKGFSKYGNGLSYLGYFALSVHFILEALNQFGLIHFVGSVSTHIFSFLCMGIVIPAMMIRIAQGHTGRPLNFTRSDHRALDSLLIAGALRLLATQLWPQQYSLWIVLAAVFWGIGFAILGWRLIPFLIKPRIDGKEH